ncbi:chitinase [Cantharellus anzutake]|uniref:chitinase n=1 Tax=Cantharellus anzutake TaxID=1750568 RepID=UPI0019041F88|nr:chitinase [Cantharellus anzutake]KAF8329382.1 chitinase [Cantharellus anzutake]
MHFFPTFLLSLPAVQASLASPWASLNRGVGARHKPVARSLVDRRTSPPIVPDVALSWYAGWHAANLTPAEVSWEKYSVITFAFVVTTPDISELSVAKEDDATLRQLVALGHRSNTSVLATIGGWTGSMYFSTSVATEQNRTKFVAAINNIVKEYQLDGVDIDWEYPDSKGIGCNTLSASDTANFLEFLKELRASELKDKFITASTAIKPFLDASGNPLRNVSEFADVLSWIHLMVYDIWGSWSPTTGPNAPLNDSCVATTPQSAGSAVSAVQAWTEAGFPLEKLVLGVPSYGHSFTVYNADAFQKGSTTDLVDSFRPFNASATPFGDSWQSGPGLDACGNLQGNSGEYDFWAMIQLGLLDENGLPVSGTPNIFDTCSQTPSIYITSSNTWIEYDDPRSFKAKGEFIRQKGLKGFAMWEAAGDWDDLLLDAIREGAGFPNTPCHP